MWNQCVWKKVRPGDLNEMWRICYMFDCCICFEQSMRWNYKCNRLRWWLYVFVFKLDESLVYKAIKKLIHVGCCSWSWEFWEFATLRGRRFTWKYLMMSPEHVTIPCTTTSFIFPRRFLLFLSFILHKSRNHKAINKIHIDNMKHSFSFAVIWFA